MSASKSTKPLEYLEMADEPIREIIKQVIKLEGDHIHQSHPRLKDDFIKIVEELINETD